jgi:hypothetical protein
VRLRILYHNIFVGLYTNQHFLRHCLEWILDLFFGSCVKKCQQTRTDGKVHNLCRVKTDQSDVLTVKRGLDTHMIIEFEDGI